jgi:esterase/lipase
MVQKIPSVTFTIDNKFDEGKNKNLLEKNLEYIPCLFYAPENKSDIILLYFHSNYEDIGNSSSLLKLICKFLNINVLSIEYPNYGIYTSKNSANAETILSDADSIFKFINEVQNINENNIILMGRCIGSGPATYLAKKYNVMSLILLSPLKSIKEAIKTMFPRLKIGEVIQNLVKERFNNMENISEVTSPILFIHGKKDTLIPPSHSIDLINKCKSPSKLVSPTNMTHNTFDYVQDVIVHIRNFLKVFTNYSISYLKKKENILNNGNNNEINGISFPNFMFKCPYMDKI